MFFNYDTHLEHNISLSLTFFWVMHCIELKCKLNRA